MTDKRSALSPSLNYSIETWALTSATEVISPTGQLRHCLTVGAEIRGPVDEGELRARLDGLIARRPALGSVFTDHGTHRLADGSMELRRQAASGPDAVSRWRTSKEVAGFEGQRPFSPGSIL